MSELLAPAGSLKKIETAFHFGADAVYIGGSSFSLRAYADNFENNDLVLAVKKAKSCHKKIYVAVNIYAKDSDFERLGEYLRFLESIGVDAVIIADMGVFAFCRKIAPKLSIHVSTQANTTNSYAAALWKELGAERIVLARECSLKEIEEIHRQLPEVQLEAFVHGAMCVAESGRCLLSAVMSGRSSNRGECAQPCRYEYALCEKTREGEYFPLIEDERGSYLLNSKDLNMLAHLQLLKESGVSSFKIEGRMKSEYYIGCVVNAYRRVMDGESAQLLESELKKTSHRGFTTGFYFDSVKREQYESSRSEADYEFVAEVVQYLPQTGEALIEQRNRFSLGDTLEILSVGDSFNKTIEVTSMRDETGESVTDAKRVQQKLWIKTSEKLSEYDILRRKRRK